MAGFGGSTRVQTIAPVITTARPATGGTSTMGAGFGAAQTKGTSVGGRQTAAVGGARPQAPAPPMGGGFGGGGGGGGGGGAPVAAMYMPPEITSLNTRAQAPAEVEAYRKKFEGKLGEFEKGAGAAATAAMEETNADIERQVRAAKEQAAAEGRPFDEGKMRAELSRGKYRGLQDTALKRDEALLGHMEQGLGVVTAGGQMAMDMSRHNLDQQRALMDYYLGRAGASRDAARVGIEGYNADTTRQSAQSQQWLGLLNSMQMFF